MNRIDRQFINWIFESTAVVVIFTLVGNALDKKFGTGANLMSLGLLLGFGLEGWNFYKIYQRSNNNSSNNDKKQGK